MSDETEEQLVEMQLIRAAQRGSLDAFGQLVVRHQHNIRALLAVRLSDMHDAEDLAQETFIIAHGKLAQFDPARPLRPWLRGIGMNLLRNHQRKYRPEPHGHQAELEKLANQAVEETHAQGGEEDLLEAARYCLEKLDQPSRDLLKLRYTDALPLARLCAQVRKKHSAVTMWLHRIRTALRACIERRLAETHL